MESPETAIRRRKAKAWPETGVCRHCGHTQAAHFTYDGEKICAACFVAVESGTARNYLCEFESK